MTPVIAPAEELFGVGDLASPGPGIITASMPIGPWLRDPSGALTLGAWGVLVDDAFGYAVNEGAGADGWSVTTEVALDLVAPLPLDGGPLLAEGRLVSTDEHGALARGEVRDAGGTLLASGHERGCFVDDLPDADGLVALLGGVEVVAEGLRVDVSSSFGNPHGILHGGVSLCLADLADLADLVAVPEQPRTTGLRVHYLRPVAVGTSLTVESIVVHRGRSLALVDVTARGQDGRMAFRASVTRQ